VAGDGRDGAGIVTTSADGDVTPEDTTGCGQNVTAKCEGGKGSCKDRGEKLEGDSSGDRKCEVSIGSESSVQGDSVSSPGGVATEGSARGGCAEGVTGGDCERSAEGVASKAHSGGSAEGVVSKAHSGGSAEGVVSKAHSGGSAEGVASEAHSGVSADGVASEPNSGVSADGMASGSHSGGSAEEGGDVKPKRRQQRSESNAITERCGQVCVCMCVQLLPYKLTGEEHWEI
jgi:hypothetical protein